MKYMGSKKRLAKDIVPILNKIIKKNKINTYIEPFVGGANIIENINADKKIGSDINKYLISMWNKLKNGWIPPKLISKELYNDIKTHKEKYEEYLVAVAGFCATYNSKWFGGYAGIVKTKLGTYRNYYDESIRNILKQIVKLKDVNFVCEDYKYFSNYKNCLIYCDPPYQNTTRYDYIKDFNYEEYWNWIRSMSKYNIVIVSEYNAPKDFCVIFEKTLTTTLDKNSRKIDTEKLFVLNNLKLKYKII